MHTAFCRRVARKDVSQGGAYETARGDHYPHGLARVRMVRESTTRYAASDQYEDEGSERIATGSVSVAIDAFWRATLTVPLPREDTVFIRIEREGPLPEGYRGAEESAGFSAPVKELEVVLRALVGVIAQARRDGVLM